MTLPYAYDVELWLAKKDDPGFSRKDLLVIAKMEQEFNRQGVLMANPKTIRVLGGDDLGSTHLRVALRSGLPLNTLGRSLSAFTRLLLREESFAARVTPNGQLFKTVDPNQTALRETLPPPDEFTDQAFVSSLLEFFMGKKSDRALAQRQRACVRQMKELWRAACLQEEE